MVQTYTAIPQYTADYYHVSLSEVNWIALIGTIVSLVVGFITIAILDIFGLRTAVRYIHVSLCINVFVR